MLEASGRGADTAGSVCIKGKHSPTPLLPDSATPIPPGRATPTRSKCVQVEHDMTFSADELDKKIQDHLEAKATEW